MVRKAPQSVIVLERILPGLNSRDLQALTARASRAAGLRGAVSVLLTGNAKIRQLNFRFRGQNQITDVLSFPAAVSNGCAGDIAICLGVAARNARLLGHSVSDEVRILILHGILHLAGYDHENDRGEMARKEIALRKKFGLPVGLIERSLPLPVSSSTPGRKSSRPRTSRKRQPRT